MDLEELAHINPKFASSHRYLALAYHRAGHENEARAAANASIIDDSQDSWGYCYRAEIYESLGQRQAAIADYQKVVENDYSDENRDIARAALRRLGAD